MSLKPLYLWLIALNVMCLQPFSYGPLSFACLMIALLILWKYTTTTHTFAEATADKALIALASTSIIISVISAITGMVYQPEWLVNMGGIIDIGANTFAATDAFAHGLNPYTSKTQLWVTQFPANTPHLEVANGQITMFGIPYYHGYPYFPLMLMSYLPAYWLDSTYTAIRITHIVLILLNIAGFKWLLDKFVPGKEQRRIALLIAITAYLGLLRYTIEAVLLGVTDILISTYLLYCFVALSYQRYLLAGILLGCAQACKLLPAPFIFICIMWLFYNNRGIYGRAAQGYFLAGFVLACAVIILPFIAWHREGFLSSTILYYLTHHQDGDTTSLWYFLPSAIQPAFLMTGLLLTVGSIFGFMKKGQYSIFACITAAFASYVIFMSFSKMTHLNYLWGVYPLGCAALALSVCKLPVCKLPVFKKQTL